MVWWLAPGLRARKWSQTSQSGCLIPGPVCSLGCAKVNFSVGRDNCFHWIFKMVCDNKKPKNCCWAHQLPQAVALKISCTVHLFCLYLCKCHTVIAGPLKCRWEALLRSPVEKTAQPEMPWRSCPASSVLLIVFSGQHRWQWWKT